MMKRRRPGIPAVLRTSITNPAEAHFASRCEAEGKLWFYQPKVFRLPEPFYTYRPDFYVVDDDCFYEVIGTRQAYSLQRRAIEVFRAEYPSLRLEIVNIGAWTKGGPAYADDDRRRVAIPKRIRVPMFAAISKAEARELSASGREVLGLVRALGFRSYQDGLKYGVSPSLLSNILRGRQKLAADVAAQLRAALVETPA